MSVRQGATGTESRKSRDSYERAADFLDFNGNDLVCLQHEYGIYGGTAGSHILTLLRRLKMPLVTTLHTVLREPDANQRDVLEEMRDLSDRSCRHERTRGRLAGCVCGPW